MVGEAEVVKCRKYVDLFDRSSDDCGSVVAS
jgi:hypothetical protein